jgi:hypothetical protein
VSDETGSCPTIKGFNRVELLVGEGDIDKAARQFNDVFGLHLPEPQALADQSARLTADLDGSIELVAPIGGRGSMGQRLADHGPGQIGPLVWEVDDIERTRAWLTERGYRIIFEFDGSAGGEMERSYSVYQLFLDPEQWFGFGIALMRRGGASGSAFAQR